MVLKSCNVNEPLYYAKLVSKKDTCLSVENVLVLKFDKSHVKEIIELNFLDNIDNM